MTKNSRVIWSEGLFLQPQHLQQQERFLLAEMQARTRTHAAPPQGFDVLEFDEDLLAAGQILIKKASGFFADGTYFSIPDRDPAPASFLIPAVSERQDVFLCLPTPHWNAPQLAWTEPPDAPVQGTRFVASTLPCNSIYDHGLEEEPVQIASLNLHLSMGQSSEQGHVRLPVAVLQPASRGNTAQVDAQYIAPSLNVQTSPGLHNVLQAVLGLLNNKVNVLQGRRLRKGSHNTAELGDFMLLQSCTRHRLLIAHLMQTPIVHPERAYQHLLACLGDVCLHGDDTAVQFSPKYDHLDLHATFDRIFKALNQALSGLNDQHALQIPLQCKSGGVHLGHIADRALLHQAHFFLTVHALAPEEHVQRTFPTTVKIGPVERLRDLVNLNLPGVRLKHLTHVPPAMPYYADHLVFQLETRGEALWQQLENTGHLAIHFAGELPELRLELWAVRKTQEGLL
ncbi:MAG TPA: type VI secretion system baseplate subunit TssK [Limnobacter sp.]|nr:type VI secretion system baseplate subunit TssK [Limnobacter sp.]